MRRSIAVASIALFAACNNFTEHKLPTFAAAQALGRTVDVVPTIPLEAIPPDMPAMVSFARIHGDFEGSNIEWQCVHFRQEIVDRGWDPDIIVYAPAGSAFAGVVSNYIGFGVTMSNAVYRPQADAYCMRLCPVTLGFRLDDNQMVLEVSEPTRESGIQEGDTVLSVNGRSVRPDTNGISELSSEILTMKPGDLVKIVWIRPGAGRMEGSAAVAPPRGLPPSIASVAVPLPMVNAPYAGGARFNRPVPAKDPLARPQETPE